MLGPVGLSLALVESASDSYGQESPGMPKIKPKLNPINPIKPIETEHTASGHKTSLYVAQQLSET